MKVSIIGCGLIGKKRALAIKDTDDILFLYDIDKKAAKKLASPEKLKARATVAARNLIIKKILKNKSKADLSFAARTELEKKVKKKSAAIKKIAKKLLPQVKKADKAKLKKTKTPGQ